MPAQVQKGFTATDGISMSAGQLNSMVDSAIILPGAITEQTALAPVAADSFLYYNSGLSALRKCTLQNIIDSFPVDAAAASKSLRTLGGGATQAALGNDTRFPASVTGIRVGAGAGSADRVVRSDDMMLATGNLAGTTNINWTQANFFWDTITVNKVYTFTSPKDGGVIIVALKQQGHSVTWPAGWIGGAPAGNSASTLCVYTICYAAGFGTFGTVVNLG